MKSAYGSQLAWAYFCRLEAALLANGWRPTSEFGCAPVKLAAPRV